MSRLIRLRLLVGKLEDEDTPVVAASIDESIYEVAGEDAWNVDAVKATWPPDYEWREVIVVLRTHLVAEHFEVPDIRGSVIPHEAAQ